MNTVQHRATFASAYALKKADTKSIRLMDCLLCIADAGHREFFAETKPGEFAVIDVITKSKAWFEQPKGFGPDEVETLIGRHFGVRAFRADTRLWLV